VARRRSRARGWALQVLYAWEMRDDRDRLPDMLREFLATRRVGEEAREYLETLISAVDLYLEPVDVVLGESLVNWRLERLSIIDRSILRLGATEMLHLAIPPRVVIQEALLLAGKYGTAESPRFINGVLDGLMRRHAASGAGGDAGRPGERH
jgi:transcription antitermination protein NusB